MHKNQIKADTKYREKMRKNGFAPVTLWVPAHQIEALKRTATKMRDAHLELLGEK